MTLDTISLDKSSKLKEGANGNNHFIVIHLDIKRRSLKENRST
jgi:hypothetical protein